MKMKIDQYFKKRLDVPQQPPVDAWDYIQNHLEPEKKERRKVFPFWMKTSGIAALFLLLVGTGYLMNRDFMSSSTSSTNSHGTSEGIAKNSNSELNHAPVNPSDAFNSPNTSDSNFHESETNSSFSNSSLNSHSNSSLIRNTSTSFPKTNGFIRPTNNSNKIFSATNQSVDNTNNSTGQKENNPYLNNSLVQSSEKENLLADLPQWNREIPGTDKVIEEIMESPIAKNDSKTLWAKNNSSVKEKSKSKIKKEMDFDRFYISGFVSPMAMNTFVGNSMLADNMSQYKTENNITLAYGIKGAYAVSPRVKVRTGVSVVGFEQITKDVPFSYNIEAREIYATNDSKNNIHYKGNLRIQNTASSLANMEVMNSAGNGNIQQQTQYYEIPLEAEVALFQNGSIGISATGGGSTWMLAKNKIYAHVNDYTEELGQANNLNKTSFSANAGLKFDMKIMDNVQINVEPSFKYLINPVNNIEKYNPYTVGVNAGVTVSLK